jgi:ribosome biogenesis GTPase
VDNPSREGLVLRVDAKVCHVEIDGQRHAVPLAGKLFEDKGHEKRPIAVGDRVRLRLGADGSAIEAVLPRATQLERRAASEGGARAQVVAANVSLVLVAAAAAEPPFQPDLVDGVLAAASRASIPSALVITKQDLDPAGAGLWAQRYRSLGYRVLVTSTAPGHATADALAELGALLHDNRSVICGVSGAGKSSLLNTVVPGLALRVGGLNSIRQGRHTTSHTELIPLPGGGHVLDTPGVRNFHLFHCGSQEVQFLLPEIGALLPRCAYRSCLHQAEQGCAVTAAVAAGTLLPSRYASYRAILAVALQEEQPPTGQVGEGGARRGRPRRRR